MQYIHSQYKEKVEDEQYYKVSYENAQKKFFMELELLYSKSKALSIMLTDFPSLICYSTLPGTLESYMYIENLKLESEDITRSVKTHEAFITLYALNTLRKLRVPNFEYYHAVIENKFDEEESCQKFFVISEFGSENHYKTFEQILREDSYENILAYFVSILFALHTANTELSYTHYNLTPQNIQMRYITEKTFECEYMINNRLYYVNLYKYLPVIVNNEKAYVKIQADDQMRSFGYNDINQIPFETKGIYTDRGFVITDAYRLFVNMLRITKKYNPEVYESLYELFEYFDGCHSDTDYLPYCDKTNLLNIKDFIEYISDRNDFLALERHSENFCSEKSIKALYLRSIGYELKLKSKNITYYSVQNIIQLYDFLKFYSDFINDKNTELINSIIEKGSKYYIEYFEEKNIEQAIEEIDALKKEFTKSFDFSDKISNFENPNLLKNSKVSKDCIAYINTLQKFNINWNKVKLYHKIFGFLSYSNPEYESLYNEYESLIFRYTNEYKFNMKNLLIFRNNFRNNLDLYCIYKNQILFLETLE